MKSVQWWFYRKDGKACALCRIPYVEGERKFAKDHDHENGKERGTLCSNCNTGLGMLRDSPDLLRQAASYVAFWKFEHSTWGMMGEPEEEEEIA